jgi:DNA-binding transcriptional MerR regulator
MDITADMIKSLREETGISIMQCKKALEEANGDMEQARVALRAIAASQAEKKSDRTIGAGIVAAYIHGNKKMGVESLKIEGRTKSLYYVARVTRAYRKAIDDMAAGLPFDESLIEDLEHLANRGYTPGFFGGTIPGDAHNDGAAVSRSDKSRFCGMVASYDSNTKRGFIHVRNFMARGDEIEVLVPSGNQIWRVA